MNPPTVFSHRFSAPQVSVPAAHSSMSAHWLAKVSEILECPAPHSQACPPTVLTHASFAPQVFASAAHSLMSAHEPSRSVT